MWNHFLAGAWMMAAWVSSLCFLKCWTRERERLFLVFSLAFLLLGLEKLILEIITESNPNRPFAHIIRLGAFLLIICGIVDCNRRGRQAAVAGAEKPRHAFKVALF